MALKQRKTRPFNMPNEQRSMGDDVSNVIMSSNANEKGGQARLSFAYAHPFSPMTKLKKYHLAHSL